MPYFITGPWDEGVVLSEHSSSSIYLGEDEYGHKQFRTTYTELGYLVHQLKYCSNYTVIPEIQKKIVPFLDGWLKDKNINTVLPIPPTRRRSKQPVFLLAKMIAEQYGFAYFEDVLQKISFVEAKKKSDVNNRSVDEFSMSIPASRRQNILLVDDVWNTGTTMRMCASVLKRDPLIEHIFALAMTKTRKY